jgi:hypothetical protein
MADNGKTNSGIGMYSINRRKYPAEELLKYKGHWVAWSQDGTRILGSGEDFDATFEQLLAAGLDPHKVVWDHMDLPGEDGII